MSVLFTKYYWSHQIEKDEMDGETGTYGIEKKCIQRFGRETSTKKPLERARRSSKDNKKIAP